MTVFLHCRIRSTVTEDFPHMVDCRYMFHSFICNS